MKKTQLVLLTLVPCLTFGTWQVHEKIIYNGSTNILFSRPMDENMVQEIANKKVEVTLPDGTTRLMSRTNTACKRGYIGTWEIRDDTLYLVKLLDADENHVPAAKLIDGASYPLKADWFTGELRIGTGDPYMKFSSTEVFLPLTNGIASAEPGTIDRLAEQDAFKKELATLKDSQDQLEHDLYEYIFHYSGPNNTNEKLEGLFNVSSEDLDEVHYPFCYAFNRMDEPGKYTRSYIRFLPTDEPRVYKAESIHKKLYEQAPIHYVAFFKDKAFSFYGYPYQKTNYEWTDGKPHITRTTDVVKAEKEAFDAMVSFRNMLEGETIIPDKKAFSLSIALSTNALSINDPLTIALTISNRGEAPLSLCANDLDVEFMLEDATGTDITGLGPSDWIVRGAVMPITLEAGETKPFGHIQAGIWNRTWKDRNMDLEYSGIGLEVDESILEAGYPLKTIPGDYYISVQIRVQKDEGTELKFVSEKQKIHIHR